MSAKPDLPQRIYEVVVTRPPLPVEQVRAVLATYDLIAAVRKTAR